MIHFPSLRDVAALTLHAVCGVIITVVCKLNSVPDPRPLHTES